MNKIPITVAGHAALVEELQRRTGQDRPAIIEAISEARAHGDLSENAEYHAAKEQQSLNEGRIMELESLLALAEIIDVSKLSGDTVKFGATVTMVDEDTDEEKTYQIVGDAEADASAGRISVSSPSPAPSSANRSATQSVSASAAPAATRSQDHLHRTTGTDIPAPRLLPLREGLRGGGSRPAVRAGRSGNHTTPPPLPNRSAPKIPPSKSLPGKSFPIAANKPQAHSFRPPSPARRL